MDLGEIKGIVNEAKNSNANILLTKKMTLFTKDKFFKGNYFYYFLPTLNKKSFSSFVKVS